MDSDDLDLILDRERRDACLFSRSEAIDGPIYFGGLPRFARGQRWPTNEKGIPLHFLAQIDCSRLPDFTQKALPAAGILQFFALVDDEQLWDRPANAGHQAPTSLFNTLGRPFGRRQEPARPASQATRVLFTLEDNGLQERAPPGNIPALYGGSSFRYAKPTYKGDWRFDRPPGATTFPKHVVKATRSVSFPDAFAFRIYGEPCKRYRIMADGRLTDDLASKGISISDSHSPNRILKHQALGSPAWMQGSEDLHDSHVLLLQLDSDHALEWLWADVGMTQFWISKTDLMNRRFERAFATAGSS